MLALSWLDQYMKNTSHPNAAAAMIDAESAISAGDFHRARVILSHVSINDVCDTAAGISRLRELGRMARGHA